MSATQDDRVFDRERRNQTLFNDICLIAIGVMLLAAKLEADPMIKFVFIGFLSFIAILVAVEHADTRGKLSFPCHEVCAVIHGCEDDGPCDRLLRYHELRRQPATA